MNNITHLIAAHLRILADRLESEGTCECSPDEIFELFMLLRGGARPSNQEHIRHIEEAYGLLSNRLDRLEHQVSSSDTSPRPSTRTASIIPLRSRDKKK